MALHPMLPPDRSEDTESPKPPRELKERGYPLEQLTSTLAAHGAGVISADLALDLILNDIVEQACLSTGATGAAIALLKGEEMVCRASSGGDAPGLGVRLDTRSGLPGACVQTGEPQLCGDAESDPRVDREACRQAGIRSILLVPVIENEQVFGIVEIFSSRSNAFGELDIITVRALAQQVVENRRQARESTGRLEAEGMPLQGVGLENRTEPALSRPVAFAEPSIPLSQATTPGDATWAANSSARVRRGSRPTDFWTAFLAVIVIGATVLMATLLVWRVGWGGGTEARRTGPTRPSMNNTITPAAPVETKQASATAPDSAASNVASALPQERKTVRKAKFVAEQPGGLVIYERGRVIYRMPPSSSIEGNEAGQTGRTNADAIMLAGKTTPEPTQLAEGLATARLVHRVEPQYPPSAEKQGVQGPVILDAEIGREGKVEKLTVVKGDPELAAAAIQAVRQWRYKPYIQDGQRIGMRTTITVNFTIPPK